MMLYNFFFQLFDLKGSMRSRYIDPSKDSSGDVLLDTNYLNCKTLVVLTAVMFKAFSLSLLLPPSLPLSLSLPPLSPSLSAVICQNPVYVYPHSKNILMQAIIADTEFLEENSIMDYSLLTCIDSSTGELVVGIIGEWALASNW